MQGVLFEMLTVCVLDDYQQCAHRFADWGRLAGRAAVRFVHDFQPDEAALAAAIGDADIVVAMRERSTLTGALMERLPRLRLIVTSGMRNAAIDLAAASARGITVCGTASHGSPPAEITWALIHALTRHVVAEANALAAGGPWQSTVGRDLAGTRLGVVGFGKIGVQVARVARAFGMEVTAWSRNLTPDRTDAEGVVLAPSLHDLMATSDIVSLHLVLSERSRRIIDDAALQCMKPDGLLINTARAGLVDGEALAAALHEGRIGGAASDVFDIEPLPENSVWRTMPRFVGLPHLGYVTEKNYRTFFGEAVEDIEAFLAGAPVRVIG